MTPRPDRGLATVAGLACALGITLLYVVVMGVLQLALPEHARAALVVAQLAALLLPAALALALLRRTGLFPPIPRAPARAWALPVAGMAIAGALLAMILAVPWIRALRALPGDPLHGLEQLTAQAYAQLFTAGSVAEAVFVAVLLGLLPALCEEPVFRGLFQRALGLALPAWGALALSAAYFSLAHLDPFGLPSRVFLGVSLGLVYLRTGSLVAAGVAHALNNMLSVALVYSGGLEVRPELMFEDPLEAALGTSALLVHVVGGLACLGLWLACARALPRAAAPVPPPLPAPAELPPAELPPPDPA